MRGVACVGAPAEGLLVGQRAPISAWLTLNAGCLLTMEFPQHAMHVIIQKHRGEFANINTCTAYLGFRDRGYPITFAEHPLASDMLLTRDHLVVGGIAFVLAALARLGVPQPTLAAYPDALLPFLGRRVWTSPLGAVREQVAAGDSIFIKPLPHDHKRFGGSLLQSYADLIETAALPDRHVVLCSDPLPFLSEYRVFVQQGTILGCRQYRGSFRNQLDGAVVDAAVAAFVDAPAGYALDVGITAAHQTQVVEVNDGYSLGCYGLTAGLYSGLLEARWRELIRESSAA